MAVAKELRPMAMATVPKFEAIPTVVDNMPQPIFF